jgi:hypothetical protein
MAQQLSPDAKLLEQLAESGSDLQQLHRFEFTLRLPTKFSAELPDAAHLWLFDHCEEVLTTLCPT